MITTRTVSTKMDAKATAKTTVLSLDWGNTPAEVVNGPVGVLTSQALTVHMQGNWRKTSIPATFSFKVNDYRAGMRVGLTPEQMQNVVLDKAKVDPKARAELIALLQGMK